MHKCQKCGYPLKAESDQFAGGELEVGLDDEAAATDEVLAELERLLESKAGSRLPRREDEIV